MKKNVAKDFEKFLKACESGKAPVDWHFVNIGKHYDIPYIGARCLIVLVDDAELFGYKIVPEFKAFGYAIDSVTFYLPLYQQKVDAHFVKAWMYVPGENFHNGHGRSIDEAFK